MNQLNESFSNNLKLKIDDNLIIKSNKFLKFLRILTNDLSENVYDYKHKKKRPKTKKEKNRRVGQKIMNNFMEYYKDNSIENFGILFNAIASISTNNQINKFVFDDLIPMLDNYLNKSEWDKIVKYDYQKINIKNNIINNSYNPIDRCIFKCNTNLVRTLINKVIRCTDYKNSNNESLNDIINIKINSLKNKDYSGDYRMINKLEPDKNKNCIKWYNENNITNLNLLKDFIINRIDDEKNNNLNILKEKLYVPKSILLKPENSKLNPIIKDLVCLKLDKLFPDDILDYIFSYIDNIASVKRYLMNNYHLKKGCKNEIYWINFLKLNKVNNKTEKIIYYKIKNIFYEKTMHIGNCIILNKVFIKGNNKNTIIKTITESELIKGNYILMNNDKNI
jgi:hypothetical protein